jgi:mRNA interferase RelE/StbE
LNWTVKWEERAFKELKKLDKAVQREILRYFNERIASDKNPRRFGKALTANKSGLWRYRVTDFRMVCQIQDHEFVVLVLRVAHRRLIYR